MKDGPHPEDVIGVCVAFFAFWFFVLEPFCACMVAVIQ